MKPSFYCIVKLGSFRYYLSLLTATYSSIVNNLFLQCSFNPMFLTNSRTRALGSPIVDAETFLNLMRCTCRVCPRLPHSPVRNIDRCLPIFLRWYFRRQWPVRIFVFVRMFSTRGRPFLLLLRLEVPSWANVLKCQRRVLIQWNAYPRLPLPKFTTNSV